MRRDSAAAILHTVPCNTKLTSATIWATNGIPSTTTSNLRASPSSATAKSKSRTMIFVATLAPCQPLGRPLQQQPRHPLHKNRESAFKGPEEWRVHASHVLITADIERNLLWTPPRNVSERVGLKTTTRNVSRQPAFLLNVVPSLHCVVRRHSNDSGQTAVQARRPAPLQAVDRTRQRHVKHELLSAET